MNRKPLDFLKGAKLPKVSIKKADIDTLILRFQLFMTKLSFNRVAIAILVVMVTSSILRALLGSNGDFTVFVLQHRLSVISTIADAIASYGVMAMFALCWLTRTEKDVKRERLADIAWIGLSVLLPTLIFHAMYIVGTMVFIYPRAMAIPTSFLSLICNMWIITIGTAGATVFVFVKSRNVLLPQKPVKAAKVSK